MRRCYKTSERSTWVFKDYEFSSPTNRLESKMASKRKYPKSFYDDGLGDILEWIDDEVLVHAEKKAFENRNGGQNDNSIDTNKKTKKTKTKLYGDNELETYKSKALAKSKLSDFEAKDLVEEKVDKKIGDRVRGLINRLAAQNISYITNEFEKLYKSNPKSAINQALFENIECSLILERAQSKRKLVAEQMLLVSYLDSTISHDIGATFVHRLVKKFETLYRESLNEEDKRLENIILCIVNLYIIGLLTVKVVFELTKRICTQPFTIKSVELILLLIKSVGFQIRKDDPSLTRQLILMAQDKCKSLQSDGQLCSRIEFMIEALGAIKNNNMSKLVNYGCDIDKATIESVLKGLINRTKIPECLNNATYEDILSSQNWYLIETRLEEDAVSIKKAQRLESNNLNSKTDARVCKALGLNKPAERTILSALLRVSDYVEASNVIISYGLNHCSDAMVVCVHVAIHEKKYNLFHYNLINSLCKYNRRYKMAAKFALQDKIRALGHMTLQRIEIFKRLCLELINSDAVPITILKAIEWADLSTGTKEYLIYLLEGVSALKDEERSKVMSKVEKRSSFATAMRTFTNCFLKGCKLF